MSGLAVSTTSTRSSAPALFILALMFTLLAVYMTRIVTGSRSSLRFRSPIPVIHESFLSSPKDGTPFLLSGTALSSPTQPPYLYAYLAVTTLISSARAVDTLPTTTTKPWDDYYRGRSRVSRKGRTLQVYERGLAASLRGWARSLAATGPSLTVPTFRRRMLCGVFDLGSR